MPLNMLIRIEPERLFLEAGSFMDLRKCLLSRIMKAITPITLDNRDETCIT
jgi:hypothetical protein